ncbi:MAG TPA: hypothetical protein VMF69_01020 [Gemmataceae bacterium]|nr:hypothetical protein [Gemmataceae bacterium]
MAADADFIRRSHLQELRYERTTTPHYFAPVAIQNGCAIGISNRWHKGQYCMILTEAGLIC